MGSTESRRYSPIVMEDDPLKRGIGGFPVKDGGAYRSGSGGARVEGQGGREIGFVKDKKPDFLAHEIIAVSGGTNGGEATQREILTDEQRSFIAEFGMIVRTAKGMGLYGGIVQSAVIRLSEALLKGRSTFLIQAVDAGTLNPTPVVDRAKKGLDLIRTVIRGNPKLSAKLQIAEEIRQQERAYSLTVTIK